MRLVMHLSEQLCEKGHDKLMMQINRSGGLRGLLDPSSQEWQKTPIEGKLNLIRALNLCGVTTRWLTEATVEYLAEGFAYPRTVAYGTVAEALASMLQWKMEHKP